MRARLISAAMVLLAAGCTADNELYTGDGGLSEVDLRGGGGGDGGGGGPDLRGGGSSDGAMALSCHDIEAFVAATLANSTSCRVDDDCTTAKTACGLVGACGDVYANTSWRTGEMEQALKEWAAQMCGPKSCVCPLAPIFPPACNDGACGPRRNLLGAVGASCRSAAECQSGFCLTEASDRSYAGGYCTLKCGDTNKCPAGSTCSGTFNGAKICLADCKLKSDCRTGYGCCSGPGPRRDPAWCTPESSTLCLLN